MALSEREIREATGREWDYWFALLADAEAADAEGAPAFGATEDEQAARPPELDHRALAAVLQREHPELSASWRQMIIAEYEKEMGRPATDEASDAASPGDEPRHRRES